VLSNVDTGEEREITVSGAFVAIGHDPRPNRNAR
jgi:thioredoxin reductase